MATMRRVALQLKILEKKRLLYKQQVFEIRRKFHDELKEAELAVKLGKQKIKLDEMECRLCLEDQFSDPTEERFLKSTLHSYCNDITYLSVHCETHK